MAVKSISTTMLYRLQQESGAISMIDVRENDEFTLLSSPLAVNVPLSELDPAGFIKGRDLKTPIYLICRSGNRSMMAAKMLAAKGLETVYNVEGGMIAWEAAGLPVVRGRQA